MRNLLLSATFAALSLLGSSAQAAFTFSTSSTLTLDGNPTVAGPNPSSLFNGTTVALLDMPATSIASTVGIANVQINVSGATTTTVGFTVVTTISVNSIASFTETTVYQINNGIYTAATPTLTTLSAAPRASRCRYPRPQVARSGRP